MPRVALVGVVAISAAHGVVRGETSIKIELPAQFDLGPRDGIVFGDVDLRLTEVQALRQRHLARLVVPRVVQPSLKLFRGEFPFARYSGGQFGITQCDLPALFFLGLVFVAGGGLCYDKGSGAKYYGGE